MGVKKYATIRKEVKKSLMAQLTEKNIDTDYTRAQIDQYMEMFDTCSKLNDEIRERGVMLEELDTKGNPKRRTNPAIQARQAESKAMCGILSTLGLNEPVIEQSDVDDYL